MKPNVVTGIMLTLLLISMSVLVFRIRPVAASSEETVVHYIWSSLSSEITSWNDSDPVFKTGSGSGECNLTFSAPDANGVINITIPPGSLNPSYDPITNETRHTFSISDTYGKLYTSNGTGDVDIISMTNDTGTFFWKADAWHPAGEEWIGDGTSDPAGSAWLTNTFNTSIYLGNGTDGPLLGSFVRPLWFTTGFSENAVVEPASRLNGSYTNATGVPFSPPYVGSLVTFVYTAAKLNIPWVSEELDVQHKSDQLTATAPAFMATLFSPANLYVTNPENRHVGTDPTTGEPVNEIPGAFYSGPGSEPQRVIIPDPLDGVYDVEVVGINTGTYTLVVELATLTMTTTQIYTGDIIPDAILKSKATVSESGMTTTTPVSTIGDVNVDGIVDIFDLRKCAKAYGSMEEDNPDTSWDETLNWNPIVDLNQDRIIDIFDLRKAAKHYGEHV